MPVWADSFANQSEKTLWLTFLLLASPLGVVLGFTLTYFMNEHYYWEYSFFIQATLIFPCIACIVVTPSKYFNVEQAVFFKVKLLKKI
jgi:hypothetical protein